MCVLLKYYITFSAVVLLILGPFPTYATQCWVCTSYLDPKCTDGSFEESSSSKSILKEECLLSEAELKNPDLYSTKFYCFKSVFKGHSKSRLEIEEHLGEKIAPQLSSNSSELAKLYNATDVVARGCILASPKDPETLRGEIIRGRGKEQRYNRCRPYSDGGNYAEICVCEGDYCNASNDLKLTSLFVPLLILSKIVTYFI